MDPISLIAGGISAIPSIYQMVIGNRQAKEGRNILRNLERPEKDVPDAVKTALTLAGQEYADQYMPGEGIMRNRVSASSASAVRAGQEGGNPLAVIGQIQANENKAMQNIGIASAERQRQDLGNYQNMLGVFGKYQDENWMFNKFAPYREKYNEAREMIGAGQQNTFSALDRLAAVGSTFMSTIGGNGVRVNPQATPQSAPPQPSYVASLFNQGINAANSDLSPQIQAMASLLGKQF